MQVAGVEGARKVSLSEEHACVLLADGRVRCWGRNRRGQLGTGTLDDTTVPTLVAHAYVPPAQPVEIPALIPDEPATWPQGLPAACAETPPPAGGSTLEVHTAIAQPGADLTGGYHRVWLANYPTADVAASLSSVRGEQQAVSLTFGAGKGDDGVPTLALSTGTYRLGNSAIGQERAELRDRCSTEELEGRAELTYVGDDYVCGTIELRAKDSQRLVQTRFAAAVDAEAAERAERALARFVPENSRPLTPSPEPQSLGTMHLVAEACVFEDFELLGYSIKLVDAIAVNEQRVFLALSPRGLVSLVRKPGTSCVLALDEAFGEGGRELRATHNGNLSSDASGRLYVSSGYSELQRRDASGRPELECRSKLTRFDVAPSGVWGAGASRSNVVRFDLTEDCEHTELAIESPLTHYDAVTTLDEETIAVLGRVKDGESRIAIVPAAGGKSTHLLGTSSPGAQDHLGLAADLQACGRGPCVVDSRRLLVWTREGAFVGAVELERLFGLPAPSVNALQVTPDGTAWFLVRHKREGDTRVEEGILFRVTGLGGALAAP